MRAACSVWFFAMFGAATASAQSLSSPESVEYDAVGQRWLVSNRGATQLLSRSAAGTLSVFTDDPASPAGIEIVGNLVYVADGARVRAYRLDNATRVVDYAISGASFLNGIASDGANRLWVTDFSGQRLHEVNIADTGNVSHSTPLPSTGFQPNGLWWDAAAQRLLIVSWGTNARDFAWRPGDSQATLLVQTTLSNFDGVSLDCDGALYASSWGAQAILRAPPPITSMSVLASFAAGQSNPADIHYAAATGEIGVPNAGNSTFNVVPTPCVGVSFRDRFEDR